MCVPLLSDDWADKLPVVDDLDNMSATDFGTGSESGCSDVFNPSTPVYPCVKQQHHYATTDADYFAHPSSTWGQQQEWCQNAMSTEEYACPYEQQQPVVARGCHQQLSPHDLLGYMQHASQWLSSRPSEPRFFLHQ
jgi:hypothetical protein